MNAKKQKICAVQKCLLTNDRPRNYFRFPREYDRWLQWVHACQRLDLVPKGPEYAYRNCRLCNLHFESKWYKQNKIRAYLQPDAVPTIFFELGCEQQNCTIINKTVLQEGDGNTYADGTTEVQEENSNEETTKLFPPIEVIELGTIKPSTNMKKTYDIHKIKKLLLKNEKLKAQNRSLREMIQRLWLEKKKEKLLRV